MEINGLSLNNINTYIILRIILKAFICFAGFYKN